jgi:hypothetical protein
MYKCKHRLSLVVQLPLTAKYCNVSVDIKQQVRPKDLRYLEYLGYSSWFFTNSLS